MSDEQIREFEAVAQSGSASFDQYLAFLGEDGREEILEKVAEKLMVSYRKKEDVVVLTPKEQALICYVIDCIESKRLTESIKADIEEMRTKQ